MGFLLGAWFAGGPAARAADGDETYRALGVFARALHYVETSWVDEIDQVALIRGAIRGMVSLLDRHSRYLDPTEVEALRKEPGHQEGSIGLSGDRRDGAFQIAAVVPGGPAARAGIRRGDRLLEIDGVPAASLESDQAAARLAGRAGEAVVLRVHRTSRPGPEQMVLIREILRDPTVRFEALPDGIALLKITRFGEDTAKEARAALDALARPRPIRGLVLDLRDNSGGLLEQSVRVADLWLESGVIVTTKSRARPPDVQRAHPLGTEPRYPMVVLVNGKSASASEVLAGALQDQGRAVLVGTPTFGKASVQTVVELEDHSALKLTVARYFTPRGRSLEGAGLSPDHVVEAAPAPNGAQPGVGAPLPNGAPDPQLAAALGLLTHPASQLDRSGSFTGPKGHGISKP